ncbi:leucine--tRNA ligase [Myxococcota bacterium]|nr:leucine--tRNA ligase [Myxococcota bacterium]
MAYRPSEIEPRWQRWWEEQRTFVAVEDRSKPKFYALDMFPYPSGAGLHVGHPASYIAGDVVSRKRRAQGFSVLHPMGYDAFGLPAEQLAIEKGIPPQVSTAGAIENFRRQLKMMGFSYDWTREVSTADPAYYKWTQFIFTKLYEQGLAYQTDMFVNWCPALGTVLANDEVINGRSERGNHPVERKKMRQWMLRQTAFAERFLEGLERIDWPEATKQRQREWIGKSEGAEIDFPLSTPDAVKGEALKVFTTRPDTLWGATYMVVAPEHPMVARLATAEQKAAVEAYQKRTASMSEVDRQQAKEKTGVDTGARARNPATGKDIPIWIADYVIYGYGTGAIMAVPAHDERDYEFAKVMGLAIVEVISGGDVTNAAHTGEGQMINSGAFDGTPTADGVAKKKVITWLEAEGLGKGTITYKMRDWVFSRQRYWGEPIPVLKTEDGDVVRALGVDELPLELPAVTNYAPTGSGASPLATAKEWLELDDPKTGRHVVRETDTMPGSAGSSWYFLRYCDPQNAATFAAREKTDYWMPVDLYVGGPEHTVGHLMYARMWQKVLFDLGLVAHDEPFSKLRHQGMIQGFTYYDPDGRVVHSADVEDRSGKHFKKDTDVPLVQKVEKMSKRLKNVVNPDDVVREYGADAMRVYLCFLGPLDQDKPWATTGIEGQWSFLKRMWRLFFDEDDKARVTDAEPTEAELRVLHKAVKKVSEDIEKLALNTAISALHVAVRDLTQLATTSRTVLEPLIQLLAPFAPHIAEEIWAKGLGHTDGISFAAWPSWDERWAKDDLIAMGVQVLGKTRGEIMLAPDADEATAVELAKASPDVARHLEGKTITRVIYKAGKILNLIVK